VGKLNVLLFGSNGLVGSSLKNILKESDKVKSLVSSSRKDTDLFDLEQTRKTIEKTEPDVIINAAAKVGGIVANNTQRSEFILENLKINMNILESVIPNPKIKVINLGSSCIYPLNAEIPIKESSVMTGILEPTNSPYSMAKLSAIEIGKAISQQYGHEIINLMPTNLYGPNDYFAKNNSHVIPGLMYRLHMSKLQKEENFNIWGTGNPLREFLHVDDLSNAVEFLIDKETNEDILNVGSGEEVSIKELANKLKTVIGYDGDFLYDTTKPDGNPRKLIDTELLHKLGWERKISLDTGLKSTYSWFKENLKNLRF
jgi:GDP-L-fucose synthase